MSIDRFLRQTDDPAFILDRRRRIRYVNRAWEALTGFGSDAVLGLSCARRRRSPEREAEQAVAAALRPPPEVADGRPARARRAVPPERVGPPWWDVSFFPLSAAGEMIAVLGKITPVGEKRPKDSPARLAEPLMALREKVAAAFPPELADGDGPAMRRVAAQVRAARATDAPVWITGPPGSGKQTLARVIHHNGTAREKTFAAVDCAALPALVARGVLFGQSGLIDSPRLGSLYLREPGRLPADLRAELLERLAAQPSGPHVLIGTRGPVSDLDPEWGELAVIEISLPPLEERPEDFSRLAYRLLERSGGSGGLAAEALELLRGHGWPGNLHGLDGVLRSAAVAAGGSRIEAKHLPRHVAEPAVMIDMPPDPEPFLNLDLILEQVERRLITLALARSKGNQTEAAERLGIWRARLGRRIDALKIEIPKSRPGSA